MRENEFEKQVQQKTDDLKFDPSAEVWENVAAAIAKRKKDRRGYIIILFVLLLAGSSLFILFTNTPDKKNNRLITGQNNPEKINNAQKNSISSKLFDTVNDNKLPAKNPLVDEMITKADNTVEEKINNKSKSSTVHIPEDKNISVKKDQSSNSNPVNTTNDKQIINRKQQYKTSRQLSASVSNSIAVDLVNEKAVPLDTSTLITVDSAGVNDVVTKGQITDSIAKDEIDDSKQVNDTIAITHLNYIKKDTTTKRTIQPNKKSGWELGFNFSFGASTTYNGYLGVGSDNNNPLYYAPSYPSTGGNLGQANGSYSPSTIKPGTGIVAGLFVQKNISPKTKILLGLNYRSYSSIMMTGTRVDSSSLANNNSSYDNLGNYYYRSGTSVRYKNNFYFIELPLAVQFKLSKQNKLPVYFNTGISIAQHLGSNALQFDTASGRYFNNNRLLNKTQFNLSAGLLFSLSRQAKNPFLIGPDLNFSISKMANSGLYKNSHYSFLGITIQKTFGKK